MIWQISTRILSKWSKSEQRNWKIQRKEIADQLALIHTLIDTIPNAIFVKDVDHRYLLFNRAYEEAYGINGADFVGKTIWDVEGISDEDKEQYLSKDSALLESGWPVPR